MGKKENKIIEKYLSYQDAPLDGSMRKEILRDTLGMESAARYASVLLNFRDSGLLGKAVDLGSRLKNECLDCLHDIGLAPRPYTQSNSWAMWHIAKAQHMYEHPKESDPSKYHLGNPLGDARVQKDIVDGHVGWELYGALRGDGSLLDGDLLGGIGGSLDQIQELIDKEPKPENGTLASYDLITLGKLFRANYVI